MINVAAWTWADWTLVFAAFGIAWMLIIASGLFVAGTVRRVPRVWRRR